MKRFLLAVLAILVLMPCYSEGNDLLILHKDSITAADTAATATREDTLYSGWFNLRGASSIHFFTQMAAEGSVLKPDTAFTDEEYRFDFQFSMNRVDVKTWEVDTLAANGVAWQEDDDVIAATYVFGNWGRFRLIHWDSTEADMPNAFERVYYKNCSLWYYLEK